MRELSYIIALLAVLALVVGAVAGLRILRKPDRKPPTDADSKRSSLAATIIGIAFLLSAVAAAIAIVGRFQR